jgi:hypothetical protein
MSQADWDAASSAALALFNFGQQEAAKRGLLLVDTKYEFGKDAEGNICLIDEVRARARLIKGPGMCSTDSCCIWVLPASMMPVCMHACMHAPW